MDHEVIAKRSGIIQHALLSSIADALALAASLVETLEEVVGQDAQLTWLDEDFAADIYDLHNDAATAMQKLEGIL